jgi:hypothetical protein
MRWKYPNTIIIWIFKWRQFRSIEASNLGKGVLTTNQKEKSELIKLVPFERMQRFGSPVEQVFQRGARRLVRRT